MEKKILMLSLGKDYGGAEKLIENILKNSESNKFILIISKNSGFSKKNKISPNIKMIELDNKINKLLSNIIKISQIIKEENCRIVHSHGTPSNLIAMCVKSFCKIKMMTTIHSDLDYDFKGFKLKIYKFIEKMIMLKADKVITVSENLKNKLEKRAWKKNNNIVTIYNRITVEEKVREKDIRENKINFLSIGRLEEVKNIDLLIEILNRLNKNGKKFHCTIAGEGSCEKELKEKVKNLGLEKNIDFLGYRQDINRIMVKNDILILTSKMEGIPITIIEGFAMKMVVVATQVGGIPEMITDGYNGVLIEEDLEKATKKIEKIIEKFDELEKMKENAFNSYKENWKMNGEFKEYINMYKCL